AWTVVSERSEKEYRLVVRRAESLSGVVLDRDKHPVANAEVWCGFVLDEKAASGGRFWESVLSGPLARKVFSAHSASDGSFHIDGFPSNTSAELAARAPGLASPPTSSSSESWFSGGVSGRAGQTNLQILLQPTGSIEGRVVTADDVS